jgi:SHS2 domain-containing protein
MFEILEHPADIGFRAHGATLEALYANCAIAMLSIAFERGGVEARAEYAISATGGDPESLLVSFLNEVLYWADGRRIAFHDFVVHELTQESISAAGRGEPRDPERHPALLVVKAVTYHQLKIRQTPDGWIAEVYLDI